MRRFAIAVVVCLALPACGGDEGTTIFMNDERLFDPSTLTVSVGDTVTWTNDSDERHTVTSMSYGGNSFGSGDFDSKSQATGSLTQALIEPEGDYSFKFTAPGTYEYVCIPHEDQGMKGEIVVEG